MAQATVATSSLDARRALLDQRFPQWLVKLPSGAQVAVRECGRESAGIPLVLLHGISSGAASWLDAALPLAQRHRVLAWDAPGYGHSTPLSQSGPTAADYADRLEEVLRVLGIQRCVLVGHSLGALMACAFAACARRTASERLVLISPARGYGADAAQSARVRQERTAALAAHGVAGLAARIDERLLSSHASQAAREWVRWNTGRLNTQGYLQAVEMLCRSELTTPARGIPVEVHCGDADVVTTPAACAEAAVRLGARFAIIDRAGHASPVEQADAVADLMARAAMNSQGDPKP